MPTFLSFLLLLATVGLAQAQQRSLTITNVAPTFGPAGTIVSIRGAGFNGFETASRWVKEVANEPAPGIVEFNGVPGEILFWQDDLISVKVPRGASTGPLRVVIPNARIVATRVFDVYYSSPEDKPAATDPLTGTSRPVDDASRPEGREPRLRFGESAPPPIPFYWNPWFSGLSPGERTFIGEQGFGNTLLFANPFSLGRRQPFFFGHDGFRNDRFGSQNLFFPGFIFHGSHRFGPGTSIRPFWFRFR